MTHAYPTTGMILAAGFGTRLQSVLFDKPKPLAELKPNLAVLDVAVQSFLKMWQIKEIVINTHYQSQQIKEYLTRYSDALKPIIISEEKEILETGGGILKAMEECAYGTYFIRNADAVFVDRNHNILDFLSCAWNDKAMDALLLLVPITRFIDHKGDFFLTDNGKIISTENENNVIYTGLSIISPRFFYGYTVHKFPLSKILFSSTRESLDTSRIFGVMLPETSMWYDIGTPEALANIQEYIQLYSDRGVQ